MEAFDPVTFGFGGAFILGMAGYALKVILRADHKSDDADKAKDAELRRSRQETAFWRAIALGVPPGADTPADLKGLTPHLTKGQADDRPTE